MLADEGTCRGAHPGCIDGISEGTEAGALDDISGRIGDGSGRLIELPALDDGHVVNES